MDLIALTRKEFQAFFEINGLEVTESFLI